MDERKKFVVDAFSKAVGRHASKEQRLRNGLVLRNQFQSALQQGAIPNHPRFEWLRRQARTMLELLLVMAKDYDKANPTSSDRASMADLLDIANMAQGHVNGIIQAGLLDPDEVQLLPYEQVEIQATPAPAQSEDDTDLSAVIKGGEDDDDGDDEE
jgi:hypothetical protein